MAKSERVQRLARLLSFSLHSLPHPYARLFVSQALLRHPLRSIHGIVRHLRQPQPETSEYQLGDNAGPGFVPGAAVDPERLLVATGFCQKPLPVSGKHNGCPAGRFNHDCLYLARLRIGPPAELPGDPACEDCFIRVLGHAALRAGGCFAILTSALDIANDVLIPALEDRRFTHCLMAVCPYSLEPMGVALNICNMDGYVLAFDTGVCPGFREWLRADQGDKPEQTALPESRTRKLFRLLNSIAELTSGPGTMAGFEIRGHVYYPRPAAKGTVGPVAPESLSTLVP